MFINHTLNENLGQIKGFEKLEVINEYRSYFSRTWNDRWDKYIVTSFTTTCEFYTFSHYVIVLEYNGKGWNFGNYCLILLEKDIFDNNKSKFYKVQKYIYDEEESIYTNKKNVYFPQLLINLANELNAFKREEIMGVERLNLCLEYGYDSLDSKFMEYEQTLYELELKNSPLGKQLEKYVRNNYHDEFDLYQNRRSDFLKEKLNVLYSNFRKIWGDLINPSLVHNELYEYFSEQKYPYWWNQYKKLEDYMNMILSPIKIKNKYDQDLRLALQEQEQIFNLARQISYTFYVQLEEKFVFEFKKEYELKYGCQVIDIIVKSDLENYYHDDFDDWKPQSKKSWYGYEPDIESDINKAERLFGIPDPRLIDD